VNTWVVRWATWRTVARAAAWAGCLMAMVVSRPAAAESYSFGVVPQFEQRRLYATWKPIVDELAKRSGLDLRLVTPLTLAEYERNLANGTYDFVYMNPYHVVKLADRQRYLPLVHDKVPLRSILVVRKDDPIKSPAELDGKTLAIPSFNALGASLLVRADLEHLYGARIKPMVVNTHSSVYLTVANGLAAAGGGVEKTLQQQETSVRELLRVLYVTRDMPSHPVAANHRVPPEVRERLKRAFLELAASESGKAMLSSVPMTEVVPTSLEEFLPMRSWGLDSYWVE
jgi:phosphonate transport system substrate-binding protein